jgi:hypothetical protein
MFEHFCGRELPSLCNLVHLVVSQANDHILRLEVRVNDLAHAVHVVETDQALSCQLSHKGKRNSLVIVALNNLKEVHS